MSYLIIHDIRSKHSWPYLPFVTVLALFVRLVAALARESLLKLIMLSIFVRVNPKIAAAVSRKLRGQTYLLMERQLPLVLASDLVDEDELSAIAAAILATEVKEFDLTMPSFPDLRGTRLRDYVGPESRYIFDLLKTGTDWLVSPPSAWPDHPQFVAFKTIIRAMPGVNDFAERGCRLADDTKVIATNI